MKIKVSIIIVNYDCEEHTCNCIDSIYKYIRGPYFEIIVVDNASSVSSVNTISEKFPEIKLIVNEENKGFGAANNIGARHALGKYLFFLNPDTLLLSDAVSQFYDFLENTTNDVACCGGNLIKEDGTPNRSFGNFPSVFQEFSDIGFRKFYNRFYTEHLALGRICNFQDIRQVKYLVGAAFFIKKTAFEALNGFDERFFLFYEETDLFYRLDKAKHKTYLLPQVKIIHFEGVTEVKNRSFNYSKWALWERSRYYYFKKNRGLFISTFIKYLQIFSFIFHYLFGSTSFSLSKVLRITINA